MAVSRASSRLHLPNLHSTGKQVILTLEFYRPTVCTHTRRTAGARRARWLACGCRPTMSAHVSYGGTSIRMLKSRLEGTGDELLPLAEVLASSSPRRKKTEAPAEWSQGYQTLCMLVALLVGASPLLALGTVMTIALGTDGEVNSTAIISSSTTTGGGSTGTGTGAGSSAAGLSPAAGLSGRSPFATAVEAPCESVPGVNGSLLAGGPNGSLIALAMLLDEGPRGEYRRRARDALGAERTRALGRGLRIFSFDPCVVRPGTAVLLAASSAAAACRLARSVARHRCMPGALPPPTAAAPATSARSAVATNRAATPAQPLPCATTRSPPSAAASGGPQACIAGSTSNATTEEGTRLLMQIDGCCASRGARQRRWGAGRGLRVGRRSRNHRHRMVHE